MDNTNKTKKEMYKVWTKIPQKPFQRRESEGQRRRSRREGGPGHKIVEKMYFLQVHKSMCGWIEVVADLYHSTSTITTPGDSLCAEL